VAGRTNEEVTVPGRAFWMWQENVSGQAFCGTRTPNRLGKGIF